MAPKSKTNKKDGETPKVSFILYLIKAICAVESDKIVVMKLCCDEL